MKDFNEGNEYEKQPPAGSHIIFFHNLYLRYKINRN